MEDRNLKITPENQNEFPIPDPSFKLEASHYNILNDARKNGGILDKQEYSHDINQKNLNDSIRKNMIRWNDTLIKNMTKAGYLIDTGDGKYNINPLADTFKKSSGFTPRSNHIKLLSKHVDGVIKTIDIKNEHRDKKEYEAKRQYKIIDGMITNLNINGYLERIGRGKYKLTDSAFEAIEKSKVRRSAKPLNSDNIKSEFKITNFDRHLLEVIDENGTIDIAKLNYHPKSRSIIARIETFKKAGLIIDNQVSDSLIKRIDNVMRFVKDNQLKIDMLSKEQVSLLKDLRIFLNLTFPQIAKYIYEENRQIAATDLDFLIKNRILKRGEDMAVYILDLQGVRLSNLIEGDMALRYKTKLYSRKEEVEHDMLVYTAYQEFVRSLPPGTTIISIKNDRQMRSEDGKKYGHMRFGYPDLRVEYKAPGETVSKFYDIEIDCGYDGKTINSKLHNISRGQESSGKKSAGFGWYCRTIGQAAKVAKIMTQDTTKRSTKTQKIDLFVIDKDGKLHKILK